MGTSRPAIPSICPPKKEGSKHMPSPQIQKANQKTSWGLFVQVHRSRLHFTGRTHSITSPGGLVDIQFKVKVPWWCKRGVVCVCVCAVTWVSEYSWLNLLMCKLGLFCHLWGSCWPLEGWATVICTINGERHHHRIETLCIMNIHSFLTKHIVSLGNGCILACRTRLHRCLTDYSVQGMYIRCMDRLGPRFCY